MAQTKKKKRASLSSFSIILSILVGLALVTVIMGALGVEGVQGATLPDVLTAPVKGFQGAMGVCIFVMVLGGFLGIITETGALDAGIATLVHKLRGNELLLIPILMFVFSIGGTTYGMCEETVPFYLLLAATMVAAGFDSLTGAAVVLLGAGCGVLGSTVNPFAVGVAVDALAGVGIEVNQAIIIGLGAILWIVTLIIATIFVMRYAKKVKEDKGSCFLSLQEQEAMMEEWGMEASQEEADTDDTAEAPHMTGRQKWSLAVFAFTFVVMIVGFVPWGSFGIEAFDLGAAAEEVVSPVSGEEITAVYDEATGSALALEGAVEGEAVSVVETSPAWSSFLTGIPLGGWYFDEASTWFLLMSLVIGLIGGISESRFVKAFINGAADMMSVVLVLALARSVAVLMAETGLDMWILENAAGALAGMSAIVFAPLSFLLYVVISFLIGSSSGLATVSMPIMGGLASQLNFSVETMVMIFSAGNGLVNLFNPSCGAIMGGLALAKVEYTTWVKFGAKLFLVLGIVCMAILTVAMAILS
ncbi:YfcC family protein [uncultured Adlercreutzia sp.]|uniref:YfcC family protein n=1 Tax=uncultured Adlercreutzia sp. TaxID=875803 RepID=UPI0026F38374|nr:YfcC family protein [uncultured Adlercreutzia sp.]